MADTVKLMKICDKLQCDLIQFTVCALLLLYRIRYAYFAVISTIMTTGMMTIAVSISIDQMKITSN